MVAKKAKIQAKTRMCCLGYVVTISMLMLQGETYSFKDAIVLGEYKVDDSSVPNDKRTDKVWDW